MNTGFWLGDMKERDHLEDLGVDGRIILKYIFKKWEGDMDWIQPAQYRDRWMAVVNAVIDLSFPQNAGNVLTREDLFASQKELKNRGKI